ncbi:hypothetical protein Tco_0572828 [Tanacetum coccineum]
MANQEQNLPQQEQPFVAAKQVSFNLEDIILNTNNEVTLIHPEHTNKEYFRCVSDFISKCCLRIPFMKSPNMYQEYLAEFWYLAKALENSKVSFSIPTGGIYGEVGLNTFRNAIGAYYLPHSNKYVAPPSIDVVRKWFPMIGYGEEVLTKGTLRKSLLPPSVNNWALKPNQPEEPPFIAHMLAICALDKPVVFKASKTSSRAESVSQGAKPRAKTGHKKPATSSKQPSVSSKEATKGGSSKAPTGSKTGHSKRRKESSSAMDSNLSHPSVSTPVDTKMHKEGQQATGGPLSLGVTSEERANPQLSSGMSALNLNKPIFSASFIIHSESALGHDVSEDFTAEADPGLSAPNDSIPPQQGMDEGTKNTLYDHIFAGTDPHVLADQTKSVSEGLETVLTQPITEKGVSSTAIHGDKEEASSTLKLEDLTKLVSQIPPSFKDLDLPEDDLVIIVDESDEDEPNAGIEDTSVPRFSSPMSSKIQELTNQVGIPNLYERARRFDSKDSQVSRGQPEMANDGGRADEGVVPWLRLKTQVHELEIKLPKELKEIPTKLEDFTKTATSITSQVAELKSLQWELLKEFLSLPTKVESAQAKLKTLDALPSLLLNVTKALNKFAELFQRRAEKIAKAEKENLNQLPKPTTPPTTTPINPSIITTQMQTPLQSPPRSSSQPEGKHIKKDKGKKVMSLEEVEKESTESDSNKEDHMTGFMVKSSKKLEEEAKAEVAKLEGEVRKAKQS